MRIIAGKNKGRKLFGFQGDDIRPTSDKAREALFAILGNITGFDFLDCCCGSGAVGLEAESRGAISVLVDSDGQSATLAKKNAELIKSSSTIIKSDAINFLRTTDKRFDIIFFDPPYKLDLCGEAVKIIDERNLLKEDGILIYEKDVSEDCSSENLKKFKEKKYGKAIFSFYRSEV